MQESVIYQDIIQKGLQQGKREEARSLMMRQMARRLGTLDPQMQQRIQALSLEQLEDLGEALLDFSEVIYNIIIVAMCYDHLIHDHQF